MVTRKQRELLGHLARQADAVRSSRNWHRGPDLAELLVALRFTRPRARVVRFAGMKLPIRHSLCARIACCPLTGRELVGSVDA